MSNIQHVSDTALWIAAYRASETRREDALFHDPLAEKLAGERGRAIAEAMPNYRMMEWTMAIRTVAIDELITQAVDEGVEAEPREPRTAG